MRFDDVKKFNVNDLSLDEGNYRFRKAADQKHCIEKIYNTSPSNFTEIMTSVAEDDLGEPLLVYVDAKGNNIVMDGNRRLSALKVLHNPVLASSEPLRKKAQNLLETHKVKFKNIHAQVSSNKDVILKTIYERHAAGGGKSRIDWAPFAKARFQYDTNEDLPETEWRIIALLYKLEELDSSLSDYFDSKQYHHEVFRRFLPVAIKKNIISVDLFSEKNKKIKASEKKLVTVALEMCKRFFNDMNNGVIGLSRSEGIYASAEGMEEYINIHFADVLEQQDDGATDSDDADEQGTDGVGGSDTSSGGSGGSNTAGNENTQNEDDEEEDVPGYSGLGVGRSEKVEAAIKKAKSSKFKQLYNSICTVSIAAHPSLVTIGAWAFIESIASELGKDLNVSFPSFFSKNKLEEWLSGDGINKQKRNEIWNSLEFVSKEGNSIKHFGIYHVENAANIRVHFEVLEPFLVKALEKVKEKKLSKG